MEVNTNRMSTSNSSGLRNNLHQAIDQINDPGFLQAVYTIITDKLAHPTHILTADQEAELDRRILAHKQGLSKSYTWQEVKSKLSNK